MVLLDILTFQPVKSPFLLWETMALLSRKLVKHITIWRPAVGRRLLFSFRNDTHSAMFAKNCVKTVNSDNIFVNARATFDHLFASSADVSSVSHLTN